MWLFGRKQEDDDDEYTDGDYDSDEYETDSQDDEVLDSEEEEEQQQQQQQQEGHKVHGDDTEEGDAEEMNEDSADEEELSSLVSTHSHPDPNQDESPAKTKLDDPAVGNDDDEESSIEQEVEESYEEEASSSEHHDDSDSGDDDSQQSDEDDEEEEQVTSLAEQQSLLALAVEHDRVDILKAILTEQTDNRELLLNDPDKPPLHVAVLFGSTNATSCLLRMGANPAIRPTVQNKDHNPLARHQGVSAWELAFGNGNDDGDQAKCRSSSSWLMGGGAVTTTNNDDDKTKNIVKPVDMVPSKREGIRHAFTAEALRCIGSDEVERLQQLLNSGMPSTIDIGGKTLHGWCVEMGSKACEEITRPVVENEPHGTAGGTEQAMSNNDNNSEHQNGHTKHDEANPTKVDASPDRPPPPGLVMRMVSDPDKDSLSNLVNRLEELESLARALSTCLDNLAEEVSVCHGLLLLGGGASALASHVRSLKALKSRRLEELQQCTEQWGESEDELAYWVKEIGGNYEEIAASKLVASSRKLSFVNLSPETPEEEHSQRQQLLAQIGASDNKIRKLRASIADLSEESSRDLAEVERRGLSGGIKLVRTLREEIRDVEFHLSEAKSGEAACRAGIALITTRLGVDKTMANAYGRKGTSEPGGALQAGQETNTNSEKIEPGASDGVVVRQSESRGYLSIDIWQILLRIIGLGSSLHRSESDAPSNVMIV